MTNTKPYHDPLLPLVRIGPLPKCYLPPDHFDRQMDLARAMTQIGCNARNLSVKLTTDEIYDHALVALARQDAFIISSLESSHE